MSDKPKKNSAPFQVLLMVAIVMGTIIAGFLMFPDTPEDRDELLTSLGTTNQGTFLLPTRPISELALRDGDGGVWQMPTEKPKWHLLVAGDARCEGDCREMVYRTRQVHKLLGKHTGRLERVYVGLNGPLAPATAEYFETEHPFLQVLYSDQATFARWLGNTNLDWEPGTIRAILVDPRGEAMMFYDLDHSGNAMLEDLKHLFKYTPE